MDIPKFMDLEVWHISYVPFFDKYNKIVRVLPGPLFIYFPCHNITGVQQIFLRFFFSSK